MKASCRHHLVFIFALLAFSILFVLPVATEVAAASPDTTEVAAASPDTSDNAGQAAALAEDYYDVWFDGTLGMNKLIDYKGRAGLPAYYDGATDVHEQVLASDGKVMLPKNAGATVRYDYVLNGWYDVTNGVYYGKDRLGTEVPVSGNTVFYADWVPASYNLGTSAREKVSGQPDTTDFITTHLFDYNEMFNLRSAESVDAGYAALTSDTHREYWRMKSDGSSLGFAFLNWAYNDAAKYGNIAALEGLDGKNQNKANITQGILNDPIKESLFTHSNGLGRTYVGTGDYLYQYVDDPNDANYGYYYYDSAKNGASYNQAENRFYVYAQPEKVHEQKLNKNAWVNKRPNVETTAFLPFNDNDSGVYNEKDGSINYWFGMESGIDFWLPNDSGTNGNKADTGKDMEFRFSGDDDVWVYVDDTLVLDLGGIHGAHGGTVNFSTGEVATQANGDEWTTTPLPTVSAGNHKLTIYYLERGSSQSNCSIYFNIAPKYSLSVLKKDADDGSLLAGAEFGVYKDAACTVPAELWGNVEETGPSIHELTTAANGEATGYGLVAGNTYYVKELKAPEGYEAAAGTVYSIKLNSDGSVEKADGMQLSVDPSSKKLILTVNNKKKEVPPIPDPTPDPNPTPDSNSTPSKSASGQLPNTGDSFSAQCAAMIAMLSVAFMAAAAYRIRRYKRM